MGDWPNRLKDLTDVAVVTSGPPTSGSWNVDDVALDTAGVLWVCTVAGTPGTWQSQASVEGGYSQITADFSTTSGTFVDVTGLTVTVTVGSRPILVKARARFMQNNTLNDGQLAQIVQGTSTVVADAESGFTSAATAFPTHMEARLSLAAGSYTFKVQLAAVLGGTAKFAALATSPAFIEVVQV